MNAPSVTDALFAQHQEGVTVRQDWSWWPLGMTCTYSAPDGEAIVDAPGWAPTVALAGGVALAATGLARLALSFRRPRD